jgi:hypothetical protein
MAFDYTKTAATSLRLLTRFGQDVTLVIRTTAAYDPTLLTPAVVTETLQTRKAVLLDYDRINFGETLQDGTRILATDRRCLMDANGTPPTNLDFVDVAGSRYPIKVVKETNPAGTPVLYDMLLRK